MKCYLGHMQSIAVMLAQAPESVNTPRRRVAKDLLEEALASASRKSIIYSPAQQRVLIV